jgi:hypothetical protein
MSDVTIERAGSSGAATEQVKERVGEGAQQLQEKASEAKVRTRERLRGQIGSRSTQIGSADVERCVGAAPDGAGVESAREGAGGRVQPDELIA